MEPATQAGDRLIIGRSTLDELFSALQRRGFQLVGPTVSDGAIVYRHRPAGSALVIGIGNLYRHDDAAGLAVAARIREAALPGVAVQELEGEPVSLIDAWRGAALVYLVDAVSAAGGTPGTVHRFDAAAGPLPPPLRCRGTHAFSLADAIELGRALGQLPPRLIAYGIEGADFSAGTGLSPHAAQGVSAATGRLLAELSADAAGG
jgi:hydrogenase maturation protease